MFKTIAAITICTGIYFGSAQMMRDRTLTHLGQTCSVHQDQRYCGCMVGVVREAQPLSTYWSDIFSHRAITNLEMAEPKIKQACGTPQSVFARRASERLDSNMQRSQSRSTTAARRQRVREARIAREHERARRDFERPANRSRTDRPRRLHSYR